MRESTKTKLHNKAFNMGYDNGWDNGRRAGSREAIEEFSVALDLRRLLDSEPESFTYKGAVYNKEEVKSDPWAGCCSGSSSCGPIYKQPTYVVDSKGEIDRPVYVSEGRYTVLIKREEDN